MAVAGFKKGIKDIVTLQQAMGIHDYQAFHDRIKALEAAGKLKPTKGGKDTNGKYPPLAKKYRIIEEAECFDDMKAEINQRFPIAFDKTYYKEHLSHYDRDRRILLQLIDYHNRKDLPLDEVMSVNERLFDIFCHEKEVYYSRLLGVLSHLRLTEDYLNIYLTPEPFIYYSKEEDEKQRILIVENKDTWHTMSRLLREGGIGNFDSIIYGEGKKILRSVEELGNHQKKWFNNRMSSIYYFGDLDDEGGLRIYETLREKISELGFAIELWEEPYSMMVNLADEQERWRIHKSQRSLEQEKIQACLAFF